MALSANIQKLSKRVKRSSNGSRPFECVREILVSLATMLLTWAMMRHTIPIGSRVIKHE